MEEEEKKKGIFSPEQKAFERHVEVFIERARALSDRLNQLAVFEIKTGNLNYELTENFWNKIEIECRQYCNKSIHLLVNTRDKSIYTNPTIDIFKNLIAVRFKFISDDRAIYLNALTEAELKNILIKYELEWKEIVEEFHRQIDETWNKASLIHRDIAYPEVAEMEKEIEDLKAELEKTKEGEKVVNLHFLQKLENFQSQLAEIHDVIELCVNVERNKDDFKRYFPSKNSENSDTDTEKLWNIFVEKCELKVQLAALNIEHNELEKEHSDRGQYLAERENALGEIIEIWKNRANELLALELEKEKEIGELEGKINDLRMKFEEQQYRYNNCDARVKFLENDIEKAIIGLNQTKKFFKSKSIAQIRWELINILPVEKQAKFFGIQPDEPWPCHSEGYIPKPCNTCEGAREIPCPACGDKNFDGDCACCHGEKKIKCPKCTNPPQGGSGLK